MPYPLNNYTTADAYSTNGECVFSPPRQTCAVVITNAAAYLSIAPALDAHALSAAYYPEMFLVPGRYSFDSSDFPPSGKIALMKVRSGATGVPAQVTII